VIGEERTRIVINLIRPIEYKVRMVGTALVIVLQQKDGIDGTVTNSRTPAQLMEEAKLIIGKNGNLAMAQEDLAAILMMPPSEFTREAQELIGLAYEKDSYPEKAKHEYAAYIARYPDSEVTQKIRLRLIALEIASPEVIIHRLEARKPKQGQEKKLDGSLASYYYTGSSAPSLKWKEDQSMLISNVRASGFYRDDEYTTRINFRESRIDNFLMPSASKSVVNLAYVDFRNTFLDYEIKLGRQSPTYGTLGRFDGIVASKEISDKMDVKVLAGIPFTGNAKISHRFYGAALEFIPSRTLLGNVYINQDYADGLVDRTALGLELRYYRDDLSITSIIEYDALYKALNSMVFQVNTRRDNGSEFILVDRRKSPILYGDRALLLGYDSPIQRAYSNIKDIISAGTSSNQIYDFINQSTGIASIYAVGFTRRINSTWDGSYDLQISNITSNQDPGFTPTLTMPVSTIKQDGSGNSYSVNAMLYGNNVMHSGNTVNGVLSFTRDKSSSSQSLTVLDTHLLDKFRIDLMSKYFHSVRPGVSFDSLTTSFKVNYKFSENSSVESQYSIVKSKTQDNLNNTDTSSISQTIFVGWRLDL
jgi:hypothetical protein